MISVLQQTLCIYQKQKFKTVYLDVLLTTMNSLVARSTMPLAQLYDVFLSQAHLCVNDLEKLWP